MKLAVQQDHHNIKTDQINRDMTPCHMLKPPKVNKEKAGKFIPRYGNGIKEGVKRVEARPYRGSDGILRSRCSLTPKAPYPQPCVFCLRVHYGRDGDKSSQEDIM
jgi:hypothetical protein